MHAGRAVQFVRRLPRPKSAKTAFAPGLPGTTRWVSRGSGQCRPDRDHL